MYEEEISRLSADLHRITGSEGHHIARSQTLETQTGELLRKVKIFLTLKSCVNSNVSTYDVLKPSKSRHYQVSSLDSAGNLSHC